MMVPDTIRRLVEEQDDMEVVGDCRGPMKIIQETGRTNADAVILAQEGPEEPGLCSQLLAVYPDIAIVSVTSDMASAFTHRLCFQQQEIVNAEITDIVRSLRGAIRSIQGHAR